MELERISGRPELKYLQRSYLRLHSHGGVKCTVERGEDENLGTGALQVWTIGADLKKQKRDLTKSAVSLFFYYSALLDFFLPEMLSILFADSHCSRNR